jgi:hypothetical protein
MMKSIVRIVAVLAIVAMALPVMAKPVSKSISFSQPAKVGGTQLSAGEYKLLIDGDKATIQKGKEVLATVSARWETRDRKSDYDSVVLGPNGDLQEVRFAGDNRVLVLSAQ